MRPFARQNSWCSPYDRGCNFMSPSKPPRARISIQRDTIIRTAMSSESDSVADGNRFSRMVEERVKGLAES